VAWHVHHTAAAWTTLIYRFFQKNQRLSFGTLWFHPLAAYPLPPTSQSSLSLHEMAHSSFIHQFHPIRNIDPTEPDISNLKSCGIEAKLGLFRKSPDTSQPDLW
jgi:hypothetical protein